jgi:hypothetical protein
LLALSNDPREVVRENRPRLRAAGTNSWEGGTTWREAAMSEFELNEQMFRDFQEGLKEIRELNRNPDDEVSRKRFEKKWENHSVRDVLDLFIPSNPGN